MQQDNKHLFDLGVVIDIDWLKLGENCNNEDQNCNNGVLKIHMILLCFYNITQHELSHT